MKGLTMQKQEKPETTKASTGIPARVWVVLMLLCVLNVVAHLAAMPGLPEAHAYGLFDVRILQSMVSIRNVYSSAKDMA